MVQLLPPKTATWKDTYPSHYGKNQLLPNWARPEQVEHLLDMHMIEAVEVVAP
jgi:hypothetical protein